MRIRLKTIASGPVFQAHPGDEINVPDELGREMCAMGYAEAVKTEKPQAPVVAEIETTSVAAGETTEAPRPVARRPGRKARGGRTGGRA